MREIAYRIVLAAALLFVPTITQAQSPCLPADSIAARVQTMLVALVTSSDSAGISARNNVNLPLLDSTSVSFVTDSAKCAGVSNALAAITPGGGPQSGRVGVSAGPDQVRRLQLSSKISRLSGDLRIRPEFHEAVVVDILSQLARSLIGLAGTE